MLKNFNMEEIINWMMLGNDDGSILGLPLQMATILYTSFAAYMPWFLGAIVGLMTWNKFNGEQWSKVLLTGGVSMMGVIGSFYLTSEVNFKVGDKEYNVPEIIKIESDFIRKGGEFATDVALQILLGPDKNDANKGLFISTLKETAFLDEKNKLKFEFSEEANEKLSSLKTDILKEIEEVQSKHATQYWFTKNQDVINKIENEDYTNKDKFSSENYLNVLIDYGIYEKGFITGASSTKNSRNSITWYIPSFLKIPYEFKYKELTNNFLEYVEIKDREKFLNFKTKVETKDGEINERAQGLQNKYSADANIRREFTKTFMEVSYEIFNPIEAGIFFPSGVVEKSNNENISKNNFINSSTNAQEKVQKFYNLINETYKDNKVVLNIKQEQFREMVTFLAGIQSKIKTSYSVCSLRQMNFDINNKEKEKIFRVQYNPQEMCDNSFSQFLKYTNEEVNKIITKKYLDNQGSSLLKETVEINPVIRYFYGLNKIIEDDFIKKELNDESMLIVLNEKYKDAEYLKQNKEIYKNALNISKKRIEEIQKNNRFLLTEFAVRVDNESKDRIKTYEALFGSMNSNTTAQKIEEIVSLPNGKKISWVELGTMMGFMKDTFDSYIQYQLLSIDAKESVDNKLQQTKKIHDTYSNEAIIESVQDASMTYLSVKAVVDITSSLFDSSSGSFKSLVASPFQTIGSLFTVGKKLLEAGLYVALANIAIIFILYVLPSFIWLMGVFIWYFKTSVILAVLPLSIIMLSLINFNQIKTAILKLISLFFTPIIMVVMFFIILQMSSMIPIFIDKLLPFLSVDFLVNTLSEDNLSTTITEKSVKLVDGWFDMFNLIKMVISLFLTVILYTFFLKVSEYIDMIIGSSVSTGEGERMVNKVMQPVKMSM